jgi:hypothetical protein
LPATILPPFAINNADTQINTATIIFLSVDMILLLSWFYVTSTTFNLAALTLKADIHNLLRRKSVNFAQVAFFYEKNPVMRSFCS